jgi:alkylated DNA repair dioxygenase AlkB
VVPGIGPAPPPCFRIQDAMRAQTDLFASGPQAPEGFRYRPEVIDRTTESDLVRHIRELPLTEFAFHGFLGKRRTISFGWRYDFERATALPAEPIPEFLLPLREVAADFAGLAAEDLQHVHVIEYGPGAPIGWHKDKAIFGDVIGISMLAPCTFRLRRKAGAKWERHNLVVEPRSAYLLRGPSRTEWEHSIPPVEALRYSVTFRNLAPR